MKLARLSLLGSLALLVTSCVGPDGQMMPLGDLSSLAGGTGLGDYVQTPVYDQGGGYYPPAQAQAYPQDSAPPPARQGSYPPPASSSSSSPWGSSASRQTQPRTAPPPTSDYLPHLRDEYRSGYDIGAKDRSLGYLSDPKRAYTRFGRGAESYFNEGYADGFSGAPIRH